MSDDEVTAWLSGLVAGNTQAQSAVWERYFEQLIRLAHRKLVGMPRSAADEEDVALSAFHSFFRGVQAGRFPKLDDRHDLWKILVTITVRKAAAQRKRSMAQKRGGGRIREIAASQRPADSGDSSQLSSFLGHEATPDAAAMVAETVCQMIEQLDDEALQRIACLKMEGYTNEEIAQKLDRTTRTIERKLERIRRTWSRQLDLQVY